MYFCNGGGCYPRWGGAPQTWQEKQECPGKRSGQNFPRSRQGAWGPRPDEDRSKKPMCGIPQRCPARAPSLSVSETRRSGLNEPEQMENKTKTPCQRPAADPRPWEVWPLSLFKLVVPHLPQRLPKQAKHPGSLPPLLLGFSWTGSGLSSSPGARDPITVSLAYFWMTSGGWIMLNSEEASLPAKVMMDNSPPGWSFKKLVTFKTCPFKTTQQSCLLLCWATSALV
mmetsp:Transcript_29393/g.44405  ORF Transcript_29393/g.44405 Transcript_29393/m.44405 type:complete len:226 (-) Transcript_29393:96-773(-)